VPASSICYNFSRVSPNEVARRLFALALLDTLSVKHVKRLAAYSPRPYELLLGAAVPTQLTTTALVMF
jgi:hypothetical protein